MRGFAPTVTKKIHGLTIFSFETMRMAAIAPFWRSSGDVPPTGEDYVNLVPNAVYRPHNDAAALLFPVAMSAAEAAGIETRPMCYIVMFAASASFMTPIGYQTNLMMLGPGGYRFADFLRFGAPLQAVLAVVTVLVTYLLLCALRPEGIRGFLRAPAPRRVGLVGDFR